MQSGRAQKAAESGRICEHELQMEMYICRCRDCRSVEAKHELGVVKCDCNLRRNNSEKMTVEACRCSLGDQVQVKRPAHHHRLIDQYSLFFHLFILLATHVVVHIYARPRVVQAIRPSIHVLCFGRNTLTLTLTLVLSRLHLPFTTQGQISVVSESTRKSNHQHGQASCSCSPPSIFHVTPSTSRFTLHAFLHIVQRFSLYSRCTIGSPAIIFHSHRSSSCFASHFSSSTGACREKKKVICAAPSSFGHI